MKLHNLVYCVCIAEFDILKGNTLSHTYPPHRDVQELYSNADHELLAPLNIADMCLPDGAHVYEEDQTYMILPVKGVEMRKELELTESQKYIYGCILFRNKKDSTVKRGAIQKSILLLSSQPYFTMWDGMMRNTINRVINKIEEPDKALMQLYSALSNEKAIAGLQMELWGDKYPMKVPILAVDHFAGASLIQLVKYFKRDTMLLWYALLINARVVFVGTPAKAVANCTLASPLLVQPLNGYTGLITPYVALTDLNAIMRPSYICGTTNTLFEVRTEWWDVCGSFRTSSVLSNRNSKLSSQIKITAADKEHIVNVLGGIEDGKSEQWVREQFRSYTMKYLTKSIINTNNQSGTVGLIRKTPQYQALVQRINSNQDIIPDKESSNDAVAIALIQTLHSNVATSPSSPSILDRNKNIFELSKLMDDLNTVDTVLSESKNFVGIVNSWLGDENSQFRKYAAKVLSCVAGSIRGQLAILAEGKVLQKIFKMLDDDMPNVRTESAYCLMKISNLFIGVQALLCFKSNVQNESSNSVSFEMIDRLSRAVVASTDAKIKLYASMTLLNIYQFATNVPAPDDIQGFVQEAKRTPDKRCAEALIQLLDRWGHDVRYVINVSSEARKMCQQVARNESSDFGVQVCDALTVEFSQKPTFVLECVECDITKILYENIRRCRENLLLQSKTCLYDLKLAEVSVTLMNSIADTHLGLVYLMRFEVIEECIMVLNDLRHDKLTLGILDLCGTLMRKPVARHFFITMIHDLVPCLASFIQKYYQKSLASNMTLLAIDLLTNLLKSLEYGDLQRLTCDESIRLDGDDPLDTTYEDITYSPLYTSNTRKLLCPLLDDLQRVSIDKKKNKDRLNQFSDEIMKAGVEEQLKEKMTVCLTVVNRILS
ncbi:hypothetical protein AKO1_012751 [Acrasis kona]|uniref:UDENN domain-containing protein n=1 Tax=Acrasis kona TaxID=1008807 RepID=A0AAW2YW32_9EUKA